METRNNINIYNNISRRNFLAGTAMAGASVMLGRYALAADTTPASAGGKPNSVFGGVAIGVNTYSYRGEVDTAELTLKALIEDGLSEVELKETPLRAYGVLPPAAKKGETDRPETNRGGTRHAPRRSARQGRGSAEDVQRRWREYSHP